MVTLDRIKICSSKGMQKDFNWSHGNDIGEFERQAQQEGNGRIGQCVVTGVKSYSLRVTYRES